MKYLSVLLLSVFIVGCQQSEEEPYEFLFQCRYGDDIFELFINTKDQIFDLSNINVRPFTQTSFNNLEDRIVVGMQYVYWGETKEGRIVFLKNTGLLAIPELDTTMNCSKSQPLMP
tara:strand:+ start:333 stop:680 length:348 start_codon:yes stop_codon:yes gene_type:complete